jgi:RNA polymerase sigma factor (sigma-70 family)
MSMQHVGSVLSFLRQAVGVPNANELSDAQLLERFTDGHDQGAFEALMQRHAPLVWGVCRRVARDAQDAEDAFQATFLVLLRKAGSLTGRWSLASWLYGVGYRLALNANTHATRRQARERKAANMTDTKPAAAAWQELWPLLDTELNRLPEKYRAPLILCYLEGKSNEQAARALGRPVGSISRQLARGRELLRKRLDRRGVVLSAGAVGTVLAQQAATAAVPASAMSMTMMAAHVIAATGETTATVASARVATLTEGMMRAMFMTKLKIAAALLVACVALAGSLLVRQVFANGPGAKAVEEETPKEAAEKPEWAKVLAELETRAEKFRPTPAETLFLRISWISSAEVTTHHPAQQEADKISKAEKRPIFIFKNPARGCEAG